MKYTALEINDVAQIVAVTGCTTCPHKEYVTNIGETYMRCRHGGRSKKLIGQWTGAYHASCPLPAQGKAFEP